MSTIKKVCQIIQACDYAFSIDLKDTYLHFLLLSIVIFYIFFWQIKPDQWKVLPFGQATAPKILLLLLNSYRFFASASAYYYLLR